MKAKNRKGFWLVPMVIILLALGACKVEVDHEIWLNEDDSGKARLEMTINFPRMYDEEGSSNLDKDNALSEVADKVRNTPGTELTDLSIRTDHTDEDYNFIYNLEFSFANPKSMQAILFLDPEKGFSLEKVKGGKLFLLDTRQLAMQEEGDALEYLEMMDIDLGVKLHLPSKPKDIGKVPEFTEDENSLAWDMVLNTDYYGQETNILSVRY